MRWYTWLPRLPLRDNSRYILASCSSEACCKTVWLSVLTVVPPVATMAHERRPELAAYRMPSDGKWLCKAASSAEERITADDEWTSRSSRLALLVTCPQAFSPLACPCRLPRDCAGTRWRASIRERHWRL